MSETNFIEGKKSAGCNDLTVSQTFTHHQNFIISRNMSNVDGNLPQQDSCDGNFLINFQDRIGGISNDLNDAKQANLNQGEKTYQVQKLIEKVAQLCRRNSVLEKENQHLKQRVGLSQHVADRQYLEIVDHQKNITLLNENIEKLRQQIKAQQSFNSIKLTETKAQLTLEKTKNKELRKEIEKLKALVKELEQSQSQSSQEQNSRYPCNQSTDNQDCFKIKSKKQTNGDICCCHKSEGECYLAHQEDTSDQSSFDKKTKILKQKTNLSNLTNNDEFKLNSIEIDYEEEIVFM